MEANVHIDIRPKLITKLVLSFKTKLEHKHRLNRHPKGVYYVSGLYSVGAILSSYYTVLILYTLILYTIYMLNRSGARYVILFLMQVVWLFNHSLVTTVLVEFPTTIVLFFC